MALKKLDLLFWNNNYSKVIYLCKYSKIVRQRFIKMALRNTTIRVVKPLPCGEILKV